jgi:hypothetical protein
MIGQRHKVEELTGHKEGGTDMPSKDSGGEDEGSAPQEGSDDHLKEDQKPKNQSTD